MRRYLFRYYDLVAPLALHSRDKLSLPSKRIIILNSLSRQDDVLLLDNRDSGGGLG